MCVFLKDVKWMQDTEDNVGKPVQRTAGCTGQCYRADGIRRMLPLALLEMDSIKSPVE